MLRVFLAESTNEARVLDQALRTITQVRDLGFLRELRGQTDLWEVRHVLKASVDADRPSEIGDRVGPDQRGALGDRLQPGSDRAGWSPSATRQPGGQGVPGRPARRDRRRARRPTTTATPSSGSSRCSGIIERFRGRDGHADADQAWTRRVTDVRNWFTFAASER